MFGHTGITTGGLPDGQTPSPAIPRRAAFRKWRGFGSRRQAALRNPRSGSLCLEPLEPRQLLAASPILSEFMASNQDALADGDGNASDWIEIHNVGDAPLDLAGYHLTDQADNLPKWTFPSVTLGPGEYLVVFASGQETDNYVDAGGHLHTNFRLGADGEYLGLASPQGQVVSQFGLGGQDFPRQLPDVSYGSSNSQSLTLVTGQSNAQYLVPLGGPSGTDWTRPAYDAAAQGFVAGKAAVGYETSPQSRDSFVGEILTTLEEATHGVYVRVPFHLDDASAVTELTLGMKYDNGFVAYLNGVEIVHDRAPQGATWFSTATDGTRRDALALEYVQFDIGAHRGASIDGENVLAIHGLNEIVLDKTDMLLLPQLTARALGTEAHVGYFVQPTPGGANGDVAAGPVSLSARGACFRSRFSCRSRLLRQAPRCATRPTARNRRRPRRCTRPPWWSTAH